MKLTLKEMQGLLNGKCLPSDLIVGETLAEYLVRKFDYLEQKLTDSQREFTASDSTADNLKMQRDALAAENAGLKAAIDNIETRYMNWEGLCDAFVAAKNIETPATDAYLAEVRPSAIPEGYVLVPKEMHLSSEAMEAICFHCGDGDHNFGEFTDGTLFVGEVDYGDGKKVHGLHIATADYPEEGCSTICEFAAQLRKGVQS